MDGSLPYFYSSWGTSLAREKLNQRSPLNMQTQRLLLAAENFIKPLNLPPASDLLLAAPLSVDDIAHAVINAVTDNHFFGIFTIKRSK
ncbi:uncharacterized protein At1g32220, chloroplastic-like isoform X2 [Elaeis guineensis]|uniref:uncharacterized protein At1g32220, chloroplastic-like isoform X2 n=1 Tax=Elaeis guineensis var. tenera TaxID=51953 RepID=UPI003C6CE25B